VKPLAEQDSPYPGDIVEARLEPGEFVLNKNLVEAVGVENLEEMNNSVPRFSQSAHRMGRARGMAEGGDVADSRRKVDRATRAYVGGTTTKGSSPSDKFSEVRKMHGTAESFTAFLDDMKKGRLRDQIAARGRQAVKIEKEKDRKFRQSERNYRFESDRFRRAEPGDIMGDYMKKKELSDSVGWRDYAKSKGQNLYLPRNVHAGDTTQLGSNMRQEAHAKANDFETLAQSQLDRMRTGRGLAKREGELDAEHEARMKVTMMNPAKKIVTHPGGVSTAEDLHMQKMSNLGLEGWETGKPRDIVQRQLATPIGQEGSGDALAEYAKSMFGSKKDPQGREAIIDKANKLKGLVRSQTDALRENSSEGADYREWVRGDEPTEPPAEVKGGAEFAESKIDEAMNYALQGYQSPAEAARSKVQEAGTKGLKEKLMNYGQAKAGGLKKSLSTFAGSLLYGQSGGYVPHMAEGGFLGKLKSGLAGMKKRAGATDYHMNQAGADAATIDSGVQEWAGATEGEGSVGEFGGIGEADFNELNKGFNKGDEGWQTSDDVAASIKAQFAEGDAPDMELGSPDVQHKVGAGRAMAEKVSPLLQAGAKLGGQGLGLAGKAIAGGAGMIGQGFQAAKKDFQGEGSKIKKAAGFLGALTGEMASPGMLQQQRMLKELGMLNKGTGSKPPELDEVSVAPKTAQTGPIQGPQVDVPYNQGTYSQMQAAQADDMTEEFERREAAHKAGLEDPSIEQGEEGSFQENSMMNRFMDTGKSIWDMVSGRQAVEGQQRGGYIPQYQSGGYVTPHNNTRRLLNQARNRYGRNS
jgi:hypothetical protein